MKKTNKLISILLVLAMLLSMAPISAFAASVVASGKFGASGSNLTWSLDSDGVLTVSGSGAMEDFASVSKVPWYSKRTNVKTVVIESGVTNIGKDAFYGISSLVNATISDTVTSIGNRAFSNSGLTNFEFSNAGNLKTIGNSAFNSTQIKNMVIPDGVTTLGSYIFGYGPIKSVTIPASVTSVGNYFFEETSSLNEVIFLGNKEPETIGNTVFLGCSSLAYVSVPADYEGDTFSNMKVSKATASVAEVNGQGFATLVDAISAAQSINGAELKLLSHISIDSGITIESGNFTIDLNGKELFSNGYFLLRIDGADVTIVDSAGGGVFNATNDQGNIVLEVLSGSANISGGTFNSAGYPATVRDGTLMLTGKDFVLNGNWRIGWYGGSIDLSACTADEVRIQACADGLLASAVTLPDGWGLFKTNGTPCTEFVKNDIYVAKAGFKVTASVNPAEGGTVEGAGTYSSGATATLTATAADGYRFVNWTQNGEEVSTSVVYTFTASENRELTANFEIVPHTHSFTYSASGDTITAVCENTDGNCPDAEGTLTISAPADLYVDGTIAKEATVENNLVDTSVAVGDITYSTADGTAPKTAGTYTASVTVGGATATVQFTLLNYVATATDKDGNELEGSPYKTLADAIAAAQGSEGSTVTLLDDVTLTEQQMISSGKFTLDLNGKTITSSVTDAIYISGSAVEITIDDSGENGKIECTSNDTFSAAIYVVYGTLNIYGGEITNTGTSSPRAVVVSTDSVVNVYGGKLSMQDGFAIRSTGGTANIYGGELSSIKSYAIANNGTTNIYGGTLISKSSILIYNWDKLNVYGGTLSDSGYTFYNFEGEISVSGGEFTDGLSIYDYEENLTLNDILADDYYYKDADGKLITVADDAKIINGYVKVSKGADLSDAVITLDETQFTYSGMEHKPTVIVKVGGKTLTEGKDYVLTFANNVNAGTATVTVTAVADSDYSGEATAQFTINKKPVTVTATAPDKVYDGTTDIDYNKIVITFNGIVEGDTVGYKVVSAWYNGIGVGADWFVPIVYNVTGEDANNYTFPAGGECVAPDYFVEATADITAKSIHDGFIILGDALTYNGTEQTQTVEKVLTTNNLEATYTVSGNKATNVGVYLLTVTGTGNFTGEAKLAYEIAPDTTAIDALTVDNVTSANKADIEAVKAQIDNAVTELADDEAKTEYQTIADKCDELLAVINDVAGEIERVETAANSYGEETVKSTDSDELAQLKEDIQSLIDSGNVTENEKTALEDIIKDIEGLEDKITETEEKLEEIKGIENNFNPENVSSDDKAAIEDKIAEIEAVNPDNLTDEQKAEYDEIKAGFETLIEEIAAAEKAVADIGAQLEMFDEKRVTIFWEDDIEALKAKIDELLADENMGEAEKAKLNEYKAQAEKLTEIINTPKEYISLRFFYLIWDCLTWKYNGILWIFSKIFGS